MSALLIYIPFHSTHCKYTLQVTLLLNYIFKDRDSYHVETGYGKLYRTGQYTVHTKVLLLTPKQKVYTSIKFRKRVPMFSIALLISYTFM